MSMQKSQISSIDFVSKISGNHKFRCRINSNFEKSFDDRNAADTGCVINHLRRDVPGCFTGQPLENLFVTIFGKNLIHLDPSIRTRTTPPEEDCSVGIPRSSVARRNATSGRDRYRSLDEE